MEDAMIVELFWKRDECALEAVSAKYDAYCRAIAYNILGNEQDADESVNDTWMHAWSSMPPHRPENLKAFLGKLTRCICLNRWRGTCSQKRGGGQIELAYEELSECITDGKQADEALQAKELVCVIERFLENLPKTERMLFVRRYWYFDPIAELARSFGFGESKVKMTLLRLRRKLRQTLIKEGVLDEYESSYGCDRRDR